MPEQTQPHPKSSQVQVPYSPHRNDPGKRRFREAPEVCVQDSYRRNIIRLAPPGAAMIDAVPAAAADQVTSSVDPTTIFRAESPVWIVSGCNTFGRLCMREDQATTTEILFEQFDSRGWTWHPAVLMDPGRHWVESGAVVLGPSRDEMVSTALYHGQEAVLPWDERGVSTIATGLAVTWSTVRRWQSLHPRPCSGAPCGSAWTTCACVRADPSAAGQWRWPRYGRSIALYTRIRLDIEVLSIRECDADLLPRG